MEQKYYQQPRIPISPVLSAKSFGLNKSTIAKISDLKYTLYTTSGRSAIAIALKYFEVGSNDEVLVPTFHCTSMVDPVIWLEAKPVFYTIEINHEKTLLKASIASIKKLITPNTKALIVAHYFGQMQEISALYALCKEKKIRIIEDCAHMYFGGDTNSAIGQYSDFVIGSALKFYAMFDGGCLCSNTHKLPKNIFSTRNVKFEIKSLVNCLERSLHYKRLLLISYFLAPLLSLKDYLWNKVKKKSTATSYSPAAAEGGFGFDPNWVYKPMSITSRLIAFLTNDGRLVKLRRKNYMKWHQELKNVEGGKALFDELSIFTVPHVFPFLVDQPEIIFPILKNLGVPILRFGEFLWDDTLYKVCPLTNYLSKHCFQFPCHQELSPAELDWAITTVKSVLSEHA